MNLSAVILAGGKSSRMGRDKAFLEFEGKTLLERQIALARAAGAGEIFIAGRSDTEYAGFDCLMLNDRFQNAGPLAGIERALDSASTSHLLVLAVDLPGLRLNFLRPLLSACRENFGAIPRIGSQIEPLAAIYPKIVKPLAEKFLRDRIYRVTTFAEHCVESNLAQFVACSENERELFANWNSPGDVQVPVKNAK
ncbi:MAG: molybdenum cofactor guanylyltransferase [Verrucomicrobiota bacterium]|jgi:molybdopterin-guanine dinucleotide biosynthesis protein A